MEPLENRLLLSTATNLFTVTNTNDSGFGSLRQAILDANASPGIDTIDFNIAGDGPHSIQPTSALPTITDPVVIDGYTQSGASANTNPTGSGLNTVLMVELDGTHASVSNGLSITAGNSVVRGLAINSFTGYGIVLSTNGGNAVEGNFIGTDVTGTIAKPNTDGVFIHQGSQSNVIGTDGDGVADEAERNIISGNGRHGIEIAHQGTSQNVVAGNYIGTDVSGSLVLGNKSRGVFIRGGAQSNLIGTDGDGVADEAERNIISGNGGHGIDIVQQGTSQNVVAGNYIGTDLTGTMAIANGHLLQYGHGIQIRLGASNNTIGTNSDGHGDDHEGNVISGNHFSGIQLNGSGTDDNVIAGNFIGVDATGMSPLGNGGHGVKFHWGPQNNRIGTDGDGVSDEAERNVISGNSVGVFFQREGTNYNLVAGNYIGTDATGQNAVPNIGSGVQFVDDPQSNQIGGEGVLGNTIAFNTGPGITVYRGGINNTIRGNSIHDNGGLGIDLNNDGVTLNDTGDADTGPNGLQNYPVIESVQAGETPQVAGILDSAPGATFTIDFYANTPADDPADDIEGERYLGSTDVTTNELGIATFDVTLLEAVRGSEQITATATDAAGSTSEFSIPETAILQIDIDVKPGSDSNFINLASKGVIAVAILTTADFDASFVNAGSVVFAGASAVYNALEDVDGDGDLDLVLHFRIEDTILGEMYAALLADDINEDGILDSKLVASLTGTTAEDEFFEGFDEMDLFLSGKNLRDLLEALATAGQI